MMLDNVVWNMCVRMQCNKNALSFTTPLLLSLLIALRRLSSSTLYLFSLSLPFTQNCCCGSRDLSYRFFWANVFLLFACRVPTECRVPCVSSSLFAYFYRHFIIGFLTLSCISSLTSERKICAWVCMCRESLRTS